jgi:hypothetical protein
VVAPALHQYPWAVLKPVGSLGEGAFGSVQHMRLPNGAPVAAKANLVDSSDAIAIENECALYSRLLGQPHPNVAQV